MNRKPNLKQRKLLKMVDGFILDTLKITNTIEISMLSVCRKQKIDRFIVSMHLLRCIQA